MRAFLLLVFMISSMCLSSAAFAQSEALEPQRGPSLESCQYYQEAEASFQCGASGYLMRDAYPMCVYYVQMAPFMSWETRAWLPDIRLCLQERLFQRRDSLSCESLNRVAIQTHVDCYIETGYCDLPMMSKTELTLITLPQMTNPTWRKTAEMIIQNCKMQ